LTLTVHFYEVVTQNVGHKNIW